MNIEEFIQARVNEAWQADLMDIRTAEALLKIVAWHKNWPTVIEKPAEFTNTWRLGDPNTMVMVMAQQMDFITHERYRELFGEEPPTAPILKILASIWSVHKDFQEEWLMT